MRRAAVLWLSVVAACIACATPAPGTAGRATSPADLFPIMPWELRPEAQKLLDEPGHGIESLRACGFDTVAFVRPDQLAKVARAGMHAVVGESANLRVDWSKLSDAAISRRVKALVESAGTSDALIGYLVADEPNASEFSGLAKAVAAVKRLAPGKLAYINLYPNYATRSQLGTKTYAAYLERYVSEVKPQVLSYGNFGVMYSQNLTDAAPAARYFTNLIQVRKVAAEHGLPFWTAVSSNRIRPYAAAPSRANLLLQAYTTLAAGAHGLTWFTYYEGDYDDAPIDGAGNRTATWSYLRLVNRQVRTLVPILAGLHNTGVYFTLPAPAAGLPKLPGRLIRSIASPTAVMVGELSGENGARYAIVVNLSLKRSAKVIVEARTKTIGRVSPVDRSVKPLPADGSLWLAAGQGALLKL